VFSTAGITGTLPDAAAANSAPKENTMLTSEQIAFFQSNGYLMVEDVVAPGLLARLREDFARWVDESRGHDSAYGQTIDGRPRFDLEPGHSAGRPGLRRVASPMEESAAYYEAATSSRMVAAVADLIGPNVKLHHSKINSKLPHTPTKVEWHQDFGFTPHSNDDVVTALLMVDEVTDENGPLEVLPGSHKGPLESLWHDGRFTGAVDAETTARCVGQAVRCTGKAGAVCLMHTRLLHGSAPNRSDAPRTLFIVVYSAEDAVPLCPNPLPSRYEGVIVSGEATGMVRGTPFALRMPEQPKGASFFVQQEAAAAP
jgi:ectoine hydroxylase-related dioxygenase (phytanoyl-CoA dioxygenase family)